MNSVFSRLLKNIGISFHSHHRYFAFSSCSKQQHLFISQRKKNTLILKLINKVLVAYNNKATKIRQLSADSSRLIIIQHCFVYNDKSHIALFNSPPGFVHLLLFSLLFFDISLQSLRNISVNMTSMLESCKVLLSCICSVARINSYYSKSKGYAVGSNRGALPTRNEYQQD